MPRLSTADVGKIKRDDLPEEVQYLQQLVDELNMALNTQAALLQDKLSERDLERIDARVESLEEYRKPENDNRLDHLHCLATCLADRMDSLKDALVAVATKLDNGDTSGFETTVLNTVQ